MPTDVLTMLPRVFAGITLLALTWLVTRAFRKHPAWGYSVLLLSPVSATVFGINYWHKEKIPFLAFILSFVATLVLAVYLFTAWGGWDMLKAGRTATEGLKTHTLTRADADAFRKASLSFAEKSGIDYRDEQLLNRIQTQLDRNKQHKAFLAKVKADQTKQDGFKIEDINRKKPTIKGRYRLIYKQIKPTDAHGYIGSTVKITRKGVVEKEYRLTGASTNALDLSQRHKGGSFSFSFKHNDIEKIRVLTRKPY